MTPEDTPQDKIKKAWHRFIKTGEIEESVVKKEVADSWRRSRSAGVDPYSKTMGSPVPNDFEKKKVFARKEALLRISRPFLEALYRQVKSPAIIINIIDAEGLVVDSIGEGKLWDYCVQHGAIPGNITDFEKNDTGASGIVRCTGQPAQLIAGEHYLLIFHKAVSSSAPIYNEDHQLEAIITVGENYKNSRIKHSRTLGMVVAAAQAIENQLHLAKETEKLALSNEYLQAVINQMPKGLMIFNKAGELTHLSPAARTLLGINPKEGDKQSSYKFLPYPPLVKLLESDRDHFLKEVILGGKKGQARFLVTVQKIINRQGKNVGKFITIEEMKEVKRLVHRIIGATARYSFSDILGNASNIKAVKNQGLAASRSISNVLIEGESGTGKEMVAQAIHNASLRREGPFIALNCAALPLNLIESELFGYEEGTFTGASKKGRPGKFELADEGTLFLDEIDKMPLEMQVKLLRVLEDKRILRLGGTQYLPVDVRVLAASNSSLKEMAQKGLFREELYYRLNVLQISIPPLRERKNDIPLLVDYFLQEKSQRLGKTITGIQAEALKYLCSLDWPGNVRQLENYIERVLHFTDSKEITIDDFFLSGKDATRAISSYPSQGIKAFPNHGHGEELPAIEKERITDARQQTHDGQFMTIATVAKYFGVSEITIYRLVEKKVLPGHKIGRKWLFTKNEIDHWLRESR